MGTSGAIARHVMAGQHGGAARWRLETVAASYLNRWWCAKAVGGRHELCSHVGGQASTAVKPLSPLYSLLSNVLCVLSSLLSQVLVGTRERDLSDCKREAKY